MKKCQITIARQYGTGGREIGLALASLLGVKAYGKELINIAAEKLGFSEDILHTADEKQPSSLLFSIATGSLPHAMPNMHYDMPINDKLFSAQADIIREAASEESNVFIGRCADYILKDEPSLLRVYIYAPIEYRIKHVMSSNGVDEDEARDMIEKMDKRKSNYYKFYTGKKWGKYENYDLMINSSLLGIDGTAEVIADVVRDIFAD